MDGQEPILDLTLVANSKFVTSFRAAPIKNFSSIFGCHPRAKAVRVLSFPDMRLKCALHT